MNYRHKKFKFHAAVVCTDGIHRIAISKKGRFALLDHPVNSFQTWEAWADLGGTPPPCVAVLWNIRNAVRDNNHNLLPYNMDLRVTGSKSGTLRAHVAGCMAKRWARGLVKHAAKQV